MRSTLSKAIRGEGGTMSGNIGHKKRKLFYQVDCWKEEIKDMAELLLKKFIVVTGCGVSLLVLGSEDRR